MQASGRLLDSVEGEVEEMEARNMSKRSELNCFRTALREAREDWGLSCQDE